VGEVLLAEAVGELPAVADTHEAVRQDVEEEAADELTAVDAVGAPAPAALVVLVAEEDVLVLSAHEPLVGDGDAVGVAAEIFDHLFGPGERRLDVDDPVLEAGPVEQVVEAGRVLELADLVREIDLGAAIGLLESVEEALLEGRREHLEGDEVVGVGADPTVVVFDARTGPLHDGVSVWVEPSPGAPGMEHRGGADSGAEKLGVGCGVDERPVGGLEEEIVDEPRIGESERMEGVRKGRDDMEVRHGEELALPVVDPLGAGDGLALGAMTVAAGIVDVLLGSATVAAEDVSAEGRSSTQLDGPHDGVLLPRDGMSLSVGVAEITEDVRDVELRSVHSWPQMSSMSRGLVTSRLSGTTLR